MVDIFTPGAMHDPRARRRLRCLGGDADGTMVEMFAHETEVVVHADRYSVRFLWMPEQTPDVGVGGRTQGMVEWLSPINVPDIAAWQHVLTNWRNG